jgi:hypothetical protein
LPVLSGLWFATRLPLFPGYHCPIPPRRRCSPRRSPVPHLTYRIC